MNDEDSAAVSQEGADDKHRPRRAEADREGNRYVVRMKTGEAGATVGLELADDAYIDGVPVKSRGREI